MAISCSGSSDPSSFRDADCQSEDLFVIKSRLLTQHLCGKDNTETSISNNFAVGVAYGSFRAEFAIGCSDRDDLVWVIGYLSAELMTGYRERHTRDLDSVDCCVGSRHDEFQVLLFRPVEVLKKRMSSTSL
jgi:hypothetical protein